MLLTLPSPGSCKAGPAAISTAAILTSAGGFSIATDISRAEKGRDLICFIPTLCGMDLNLSGGETQEHDDSKWFEFSDLVGQGRKLHRQQILSLSIGANHHGLSRLKLYLSSDWTRTPTLAKSS